MGKPVGIGLTYIYGIGRTTSEKILSEVDIPFGRRVNELSDAEVARLREVIDRKYRVEGDSRRDVAMNIKRLMDLGCYRGLRHRRGCRCAASATIPTPVPARGPPARSPARRR